ncbi:MAG TPA: DoxX family protein [Ktedonobacterales bacterium]
MWTESSSEVRRNRWLRAGLSTLFIGSGMVHLIRPSVYLPMMPPYLPYPSELILVSGVAEIAGGIGLLFPPTRRAARYGLIALLLAVFPENIQMAINGFASDAPPLVLALLLARLPLQPLLIWLVYRCACPTQSASETPDMATHA